MAKLPGETTETNWTLKQQLLDIVDEATAAEFSLFERFGETDSTILVLDDLKDIAEQAQARFSQFSSLLRIADTQSIVPVDMLLELLIHVITNAQQKIPALERSVEEIKIEWSLP